MDLFSFDLCRASVQLVLEILSSCEVQINLTANNIRYAQGFIVLCADKGYKFIDDVIWTNTELLEAAFLPTYPTATLWSSTYHEQVIVVNVIVAADPLTLRHPLITEMQRKSHI